MTDQAQSVGRAVSGRWHVPVVAVLVLVAVSACNYLLFHTLLEPLTVRERVS